MKLISNLLPQGLKQFAPYFTLLKPVKMKFTIGIMAGVIYGAASGFGMPFLIYKALPVLFADPPPKLLVLIAYISVFPIAMTIRAVSGFVNTYLISYCGMRVLQQIQQKVHSKLQDLPLAFFHKNTVGDLMARTLGDAGALQSVLTSVANDLIKQPVTLISAIGALVYLSFQAKEALFLILFMGTVVLIIFPIQYIGRNVLKRARQVQDQSGDISKAVSENLNAVREVRAFNLQEVEISRFSAAVDNFVFLSMKVVKYTQILRPTIELISAYCVAGALVYMLVNNIETIAVAMLGALYMAYDPIKKFGEIHLSLKRGEAALKRIEYILNEEDCVPDAAAPVSLGSVRGQVQLDGVSFKYLDEWVLNEVDLNVEPGSVIALVGPSGAGKSTIADLIPRFYDVQKGAVKIDGKDVKSVCKKELRAAISVVSQDTFLFNDTVFNNIRVGRPDATNEEVYAAAKHAFAHDFVLELDDGYETAVGERGTRLSGGQKQRLAIARAFLKNAPILILDEATSALDTESEEKIQIALKQLVEGKTVFVIAHRFSTIRDADRIVVMNEGRLVGQGSHEELYPENDVYKRLYDRQFSED
ncbi:ABC transporter ATP-binding protein [Pontiellaceae bacterium B1224]|nr:ABC transporter ATP-binding protein [Pontiellaceae bacterium B1224]